MNNQIITFLQNSPSLDNPEFTLCLRKLLKQIKSMQYWSV